MNHLNHLSEHSRNLFVGVKALFGYYCPLCKHRNIKNGLCQCCHDLVLSSMSNTSKRCRLCMAYMHINDKDIYENKDNNVFEISNKNIDVSNIEEIECQQCLADRPSYNNLIAAFDYQPYGDLLIYKYKVQKQFWLAPILADLLYQSILKSQQQFNGDCIVVPVPPSYKSLKKRGFNPPSLIAKILASKLGLKYMPDALIRVHNGIKQANLSKEQRAINVSYLYKINADLTGADVVIVDDVFTTGSTINTIAKQMLNAGAKNVYAWVLARTPNKNKV